MRHDKKYLAILDQAFSPELADLSPGDPGFPEIAEALANDLYRLSIEFGVSFNEFKARVQQEVLDHSRLHESDHDFAKTPILVPARANLSIVVFALDLMRDDAEFEAE